MHTQTSSEAGDVLEEPSHHVAVVGAAADVRVGTEIHEQRTSRRLRVGRVEGLLEVIRGVRDRPHPPGLRHQRHVVEVGDHPVGDLHQGAVTDVQEVRELVVLQVAVSEEARRGKQLDGVAVRTGSGADPGRGGLSADRREQLDRPRDVVGLLLTGHRRHRPALAVAVSAELVALGVEQLDDVALLLDGVPVRPHRGLHADVPQHLADAGEAHVEAVLDRAAHRERELLLTEA